MIDTRDILCEQQGFVCGDSIRNDARFQRQNNQNARGPDLSSYREPERPQRLAKDGCFGSRSQGCLDDVENLQEQSSLSVTKIANLNR